MTTQEMMRNAIRDAGEEESAVECYYRDIKDQQWGKPSPAALRCSVAELPTREFDDGYGGTEGEPVIGFSQKYVYVSVTYDGSEWIAAVPRHPDYISDKALPCLGG